MGLSPNDKLKACVLANAALLLFGFVLVIALRDTSDGYFSFGPNDRLIVLSIRLNTLEKYIYFQVVLAVIEIVGVIVNDVASPILGFAVYNPDKKIITDFTKNQLQCMTNSMWVINSLIRTLSVVITISQIDIAILRVIYSEITAVFTIRYLLNEKTFTTNELDDEPLISVVVVE